MGPGKGVVMRTRTTVGVLAAGVLLALPAVAQAGPRADYKQMFSTPVPGASAGSDTQILYKHPDDPDAKPIPVREEVFTFPEGTEFDNGAVPACTASEMELQLMGEAACPPESRVGGSDDGTFMTGFGAGESPMQIDGYNDGSGLLILGRSRDPEVGFATRAKREGRVITVPVPRMPGGPPDGEGAIRRVHNVFDARSLGERAYLRTPPVCPASGTWTFKAHLTFADGAVEDDTYEMPCDRDLTPPRIRVSGMPRSRCLAHRFQVRVRVLDASPLERVQVRLAGRLLRETTEAGFAQRVPVRSLRPGRHRLSVVARDAAGNRGRRAVRFRRCAR
jgi:hypothetical protein